jgi:hypothetical protein
MKIKVKKNVTFRDQDSGEKTYLKKGVHEVADKLGKWLCQVYALAIELVVGDVVAEVVEKPKKAPAKPKTKPKAKRGRPKKKVSK